jgi:hypothetical protein
MAGIIGADERIYPFPQGTGNGGQAQACKKERAKRLFHKHKNREKKRIRQQ